MYVANIFLTLLSRTTKFKEVKIREKMPSVLVSNGRNGLKYGSSRKYGRSGSPNIITRRVVYVSLYCESVVRTVNCNHINT